MAVDLEKQIRMFKRLDLATVAFRESKALTEHVIQLGIVPASKDATLYSACCCGIVTTYARPFIAAEGLGPLHPRYSEAFESEYMQKVHAYLIEVRHKVYAHRDVEAAKTTPVHPDSDNPNTYESHIAISPSASGRGARIESVPTLPYFREQDLPGVVTLCDFQIKRACAEAVALLRSMAGTKVYPVGTYTLGKDFP